MNLVLQWIGGSCYLLNKVFLSFSERARKSGAENAARKWRVASWLIYLIGLPPWIIIFVTWHNWIAAGVEASGAPSMVLGLITALRGNPKAAPKWLDYVALLFVPLGFIYSFYDFGGFTKLGQWLETGLVIGFLAGTYLLAKERRSGYLWFVLMHVSCGWLMWEQGYPWLLAQQIASLAFIVDAYITSRNNNPLNV